MKHPYDVILEKKESKEVLSKQRAEWDYKKRQEVRRLNDVCLEIALNNPTLAGVSKIENIKQRILTIENELEENIVFELCITKMYFDRKIRNKHFSLDKSTKSVLESIHRKKLNS